MHLKVVTLGEIIRVIDGDTVKFHHPDGVDTLRIDGIDAPEKNERFWREAKNAVEKNFLKKQVYAYSRKMDKYNRYVATVEDHFGLNVSTYMLMEGLAFWLRKFSRNPEYGNAERMGRQKGKYLWSDPKYYQLWKHKQKFPHRHTPKYRDMDPTDPVVLMIVSEVQKKAKNEGIEMERLIDVSIERYMTEDEKIIRNAYKNRLAKDRKTIG